jgi:hypothetical protein
MKIRVLTLVAILFMFLGTQVFADESGVMYDAMFPYTITVDGDSSDWPTVPWHRVTHDMGWGNLPDNDNDASYEFACVADTDYLYVAIKTWDDGKCVDEDVEPNQGVMPVWLDDSMEIYIDGDNSKNSEYEPDVCQITIGRFSIGEDPDTSISHNFTGMNGQGASANRTGTRAAVVDTNYGWAIEAAISLDFFGIPSVEGTVIGFNVHFNDDDDWGDRDHKLCWSKTELAGDESSYFNPAVFGELRFVSNSACVSYEGKLITTWARIR